MGSFRCYFKSLLAALLSCSLMCSDFFVVCDAINSWPEYEEPSDSFYEKTISIKMPGTRPLKKDTYLCTAVQLSSQKQYIVQFEPSASQDTAHHMLLFGCHAPGANIPSWDCKGGPYTECQGAQRILYAWAKNAPPKYLPKDVGFAIGGDSDIRYLVLQVHYASVDTFRDGAKDYSGFILHTRQHSLPFGGGIYLLWAYSASIPPETSDVHVDVACKYQRSEPMFAFAFRTHAHTLAKVITGYRVRDGVWTLLGKGDPQAPQAFYPMESTFEIKKGDILASRCTYDSRGHDLHGVVHMGATGHDEMCNFYIMYYSDAERLEYSGGDCGEQDHPEIFRDFPIGSDTPLAHSPQLKVTSKHIVSPTTSSPTVLTQSTSVVSSDLKSKDDREKISLPSSSSNRHKQKAVTVESSAKAKDDREELNSLSSSSSSHEQQAVAVESSAKSKDDREELNSLSSSSSSHEQKAVTVESSAKSKDDREELNSLSSSSSSHEQQAIAVESSAKSKDDREELNSLSSSSSSHEQQAVAVESSIATKAISQGISRMKVSPTTRSYKDKVNDSLKNHPAIPVVNSVSEAFNSVLPAAQSHSSQLHVMSDWPSLTTLEKSKLGQVTGVSLDSKGQVLVFHRGSRIWDDSTFDSTNVFRNADIVGTISEHTVWIIDSASGKVKGFWGKNMFYLPHGLTVDHEDNLWLTDVGSHQVFKFSPLSDRTQRLLALGDKLVPGSGDTRFCKPTSVAVDKNGEFFVADGYCNSRILKFSASGKLLSKWGQQSYANQGLPAPGSFFIPHSLSLDSKRRTLYVADRENGRIQLFSSITGTFIDEIKLTEFGGLVYAVDYSDSEQGGVLHVVNGRNQDKDRKLGPVQGFTIRTSDKTLLQTWPSEKGQGFSQPHDVVSSVDGTEVYVVEIGPNRVWKLSSKQQPVGTAPVNTVPVITNKQWISQEGSGLSPKPAGDGHKMHAKPSSHGSRVVDLVEEKARVIPADHQDTTENESPERDGDTEKSSVNPQGHQNSTDSEELNSLGDGDSGHVNPSGHQGSTKQESKEEIKVPLESNSSEPVTESPFLMVDVNENSLNPEPKASRKNSSKSGPQSDALDNEDSDNITAGVIPALVILSVLAVPIVFLLLISITLRLRAYRRDKHRQMNGLHGSRKDLSVGRTRGWWSYMNCCDRQKYKFNRVTLQDFYSDSDSDGV